MAEVHGNRTQPIKLFYKYNQYLMRSKKVKVKVTLKTTNVQIFTKGSPLCQGRKKDLVIKQKDSLFHIQVCQ